MNALKLLLIFFLQFAPLAASDPATPAEAAQRFRDMLKTVDRIVLEQTFQNLDPTSDQVKPLPEIKGTDKITTLGEGFELVQFEMHCLCLTSPEIQFYQGNNYRFSMTLHHGYRLRCKDGPWDGDASMTKECAARFREWFARHGYDGFVRGQKFAEEWEKKQNDREAQLLSHFPLSARSYFSRDERYGDALNESAARVAGSFSSKRELILTCWRATGELLDWQEYARRPFQKLIDETLKTADDPSLKAALAALPDSNSSIWFGAYRHCAALLLNKNTSIKNIISDDLFIHLAERNLNERPDNATRIISDLASISSKATIQLLLRIAKQTSTFPPKTAKPSPSTSALYELATLKATEARPLIVRALTTIDNDEEKGALEVALAMFDGPKLIRPEHINLENYSIAKTAWHILSQAPDFKPSVEFLVIAANSKCYEARTEAEAMLRKHGLKMLTTEEQAKERLSEPPLSEARTLAEINQAIASIEPVKPTKLSTKVDQLVIADLYHRRAKLYLKDGRFEEARKDYKLASQTWESRNDQAFVAQTLGHFSEAHPIWRIGDTTLDLTKVAAAYLEQRGYLSFARGKFESAAEEFHAANLLSYENRDRWAIFRYLSLLLVSKQSSFDIATYDPHPRLVIPDELISWPETGIRLLQGNMTEAEMMRRINESHVRDGDLCEAHFVISVLHRVKDSPAGEREHLLAALATKRYTCQSYSLATLRLRELETLSTGKL